MLSAIKRSTAIRASLRRNFSSKPMPQVVGILGAQWGDEGKGKLVDVMAQKYDIICRFNGGANAGHTLVINKQKFAFHLLPCGILYDNKINIIGNGVVLDMSTLITELKKLPFKPKHLYISNRTHLLFDIYKMIDGQNESNLKDKSIGTTKRGIGPCYSSKATRHNLRAGDLVDWDLFTTKYNALMTTLQKQYDIKVDTNEELARIKEYREVILPMIRDTTWEINNALSKGQSVLAEGANAALLDIDHGTYPYVTSSATTAGGICTGLGIAPTKINNVIGVVKAYTTRVGSGPFPTELLDTVGDEIRKKGGEFGTTTGRPRRCGWLDIPVIRYSHMLNNYNSINITKLDILSDLEHIQIGTNYMIDGKVLPDAYMPSTIQELAQVQVKYETLPGWKCDISKAKTFDDLPTNAQNYLRRIEELSGVPISYVGVGADRNELATTKHSL